MNNKNRIYALENGFGDADIMEMVHIEVWSERNRLTATENEAVDDIEILKHRKPMLLDEWSLRVVNHYKLNTCIDHVILMQYLHYDWLEATEHWWLYGGIVGEMIQQYVTELENQFMDSWESSMVCR